MPFAALVGDRERPRLELTVPDGGEATERLRAIAGVEVDDSTGKCTVSAPTMRTLEDLAGAGIAVNAFEFPEPLNSLRHPLVIDPGDGSVRVFPRFADHADISFELGDDAVFDPATGAYTAPAAAVADWPEHLLSPSLRDAGEGSAPRTGHQIPPSEMLGGSRPPSRTPSGFSPLRQGPRDASARSTCSPMLLATSPTGSA